MRRIFYIGLILGIAASGAFAQDLVILPGTSTVQAEPEATQTLPVVQQEAPTFEGDRVAEPPVVALPRPAGPQTVDVGDGWSVTIAPGGSDGLPLSDAAAYRAAYDAIPFSRAEWLANASYRHDSAFALLTGQPVNGRAPATRELERYQNPRNFQRTFFPRLAPADLHYNYAYGRYQYRPWGAWGWYSR
jgi:hypothetical protein